MSARSVSAIVALFIVLAVLYTWPLAEGLRTTYLHLTPTPTHLQLGDAYLTTWMLSWVAHALRTAPLRLFEANIFYPLPGSLAFSEHLIAGALLILPLDAFHHDPVLNHNLLVLATFVLGGSGATLLVRELGASWPAALAAGCLFAFGSNRFGALDHVHFLSTHWMPWTLFFLHRLLASGRWRTGFAFAACLALQALSSVYYAYYFTLAVAFFVLLHLLLRCPAAPRAYRRTLVMALLAGLVIVPTFLPYRAARERYALERTHEQTVYFSAKGVHYLAPVMDPVAYLRTRYGDGAMPPGVVVGLGGLALAGLGLACGAAARGGGRRLTSAYFGLALGAALLSLGPIMRMQPSFFAPGITGPHYWLSRVVPGFEALRTPVRAAPIVVLALAVLAGFGTDALVARGRPWLVRAVGGLLVGAIVLADCTRPEVFALPVPWEGRVPAAQRWLADQPDTAPVVFLPPGTPTQDGVRMVLSTYHWRRMLNGYSGFNPAGVYTRRVLWGFPDAGSLRLLRDLGVRWAVVDRTRLAPEQHAGCGTGGDRVHLAVRYADDTDCVLEILGAPPPPAPVPDRRVALEAARLTTSSGDDARAAIDGDLASHWVQAVNPREPGWLQIDLPEAHVLSRLVFDLGPHFGEYPRRYQILVSPDGERWFVAADQPLGQAPLVDLLRHPDRLRVEIPLTPLPARSLRMIRPDARVPSPWDEWDFWGNWRRWGVHELALYELDGAP